jgi:hypothetical protein
VCGPRHTARVRPPTHAGRKIFTSRGDNSWRPCRRPAPAGALNASLTSRATIRSTSTSTLPHAKLSPRHSSTLYDVRGPRLRLTRGKSSKYSGRLRQDQTTQGEGQGSQGEQPDPATRRLPRQDIKTKLQYGLTDDDVRRDYQLSDTVATFSFPLCPSTCDYKREKRANVIKVRLTHNHTPPPGTWERTPSPYQLVNPTASTLGSGILKPRTGRRVLLLGGPNQYKSRCLPS